MALDTAYITLRDYSSETGTVSLNVPKLTAGNFVAQINLLIALESAINDITSGAIARTGWNHMETLTRDVPVDPAVRRETKWMVTYYDNTEFLDAPTNTVENPNYQKVFQTEIPTAKILLSDGWFLAQSDKVNLAVAPWPAFVSAFEAFAKSPTGGTPHVLSVEAVGRNL